MKNLVKGAHFSYVFKFIIFYVKTKLFLQNILILFTLRESRSHPIFSACPAIADRRRRIAKG
jgi:hypothetical protein